MSSILSRLEGGRYITGKRKNIFVEGLREVSVIGGGLAGLSAAIYLGRSKRDTLLLHTDKSMAKWEYEVQNYPGFPKGITGAELLERCLEQARRYEVEIIEEEVTSIHTQEQPFCIQGRQHSYQAKRLLMATGLTHLPPDIPGVKACLGKSLFFCKDCDAYRLQGKRLLIIGLNEEAAEYALGMLLFSSQIIVATNGAPPEWKEQHTQWLNEYRIPVRQEKIVALEHEEGRLPILSFVGGESEQVDAVFTTRGDVPHNTLATGMGVALDHAGQIIVDERLQTNIAGVYAAGCVTPANCQMIIAAGQGAAAAQAINRDLFEESLRGHHLPRFEGKIP